MSVTTASFTASGDIIIRHPLYGAGAVFSEGYERTLEVLRTGNIVWGSCEVQFSTRGFRTDAPIGYLVDPRIASDLRKAGFSVMTVATNHTWDYGPDAFVDTLANLRASGITPVGGGANASEAASPEIILANGLRVGILAVTCLVPPYYAATESRPGVAAIRVHQWQDLNGLLIMLEPGGLPIPVRSAADEVDVTRFSDYVRALANEVDIVIASVHWGFGRGEPLAEYQRPLAHQIIDAGAHMILGNHTHSPGGIELYKGRPIIYSLGNHLAQHDYANATGDQKTIFSQIDPWSVVARFTLAPRAVHKIELFPTMCDSDGMPNLISSPEAAVPVIQRIRRLSGTLGERIKVDGARAELDLLP